MPDLLTLTYLSRADVLATGLSMAETIPIVEESFRAHGIGQFESPPKPGVHPQPNAFIHAMPAYLPKLNAAGLKWISSFSANVHRGLPTVMGLMILNDVQTGQPIAIMDAGWLTAMRTAAASAVAAKFLARKDSEIVGIVGAGSQGYAHALAMPKVLANMKILQICDVNRDMLDRSATALEEKLPGIRINPVESAQKAIENADVVVTATSKLTRPIFSRQWIQPGALVLPVHTRGWDKDTPHTMDKFVVDFWDQFKNAQEQEGGYYPSLPDLYAELGEIVAGKKPGREDETECIMDHNYGMAIHDVAMASTIFSRAKEKGLGVVLPLM
jgi:ornithine cyclodeaminase/alanine dehydrogenase-like protein (mu-crystallin family)